MTDCFGRRRRPRNDGINVVAVGVDNGGSWIRLKGLDSRGKVVWSLKRRSPTVNNLPAFLARHLRRFHGKLSYLAVGSRGVWKQSKRKLLRHALRRLAKKVVVMSDVEAAWLAAFNPHPASGHLLPLDGGRRPISSPGPRPRSRGRGWRSPGEGIIVISGTGSIAYGRKADGTFARAGGLGPEKGDEGSGYWIGRQWLRYKIPSPPQGERVQGEGAKSIRKIASLAPVIIRWARQGNPAAKHIIREAQSHLVELVFQLRRTFNWKGVIPISVSGSVLENDWFRSGFLVQLKEKRIRFLYVRKHIDAAIAPLTLHPLPPSGDEGISR